MSNSKAAGRSRAALLAAAVVAAILVVPASASSSLDQLGAVPSAPAPASPPGPVSSGTYSPTVAFTDTGHSVLPMNALMTSNQHPGGNSVYPGTVSLSVPVNRYDYFGDLKMKERHGTNLDLRFKVENQPDRSSYRFCPRGSDPCSEVQVRATAEQGLLYLWHSGSTRSPILPSDFPQQRLEVSASDAGTGLKVYREVLVKPPPDVPDCDDYGEANVEAYVCLYLRELIPEGVGGGTNEATLRAGLPGLVQDTSNYQLVFAEEFDGTPPAANAAGCRDGLSTLDNSAWNHGDSCGWVDSRGESCGNVADGSLSVASAYKCNANLNTYGKLHYKYGYVEYKFTVEVPRPYGHYHNYNFIGWAPHNPLQHLWDQYGVTVNNWEDFLKYADVELDFIEYDPANHYMSWIQHVNWNRSQVRTLPGRVGYKWLFLCGQNKWNPERRFFHNSAGCDNVDTFTVTQGIEWTPRGYRTFARVHGFHDDLVVWPKHQMEIKSPHALSGSRKDAYFEYLDPDDTSTILEQIGIAHAPVPLSIGTWGVEWCTQCKTIRNRMKFDYIRLWQPQNHYSDMEPVYQ